jgi:hypothetical protein
MFKYLTIGRAAKMDYTLGRFVMRLIYTDD